MIKLNRVGNEVFDEAGHKLTIVAQATKGEGKEVVKIDGLEGSNGQKYISLSKVKEGLHEYECAARQVTSTSVGGYSYTPEEAEELKKLEARIAEIKAAAKARYVAKPKLISVEEAGKLSEEELTKYIASIQAYYKK